MIARETISDLVPLRVIQEYFEYFIGMAAIIISGIMLKKTKMFAGDPAPFVMELPAYHWPTLGNVLRSMWELSLIHI